VTPSSTACSRIALLRSWTSRMATSRTSYRRRHHERKRIATGGACSFLLTPFAGFTGRVNGDFAESNERSNTKPVIAVLTNWDDGRAHLASHDSRRQPVFRRPRPPVQLQNTGPTLHQHLQPRLVRRLSAYRGFLDRRGSEPQRARVHPQSRHQRRSELGAGFGHSHADQRPPAATTSTRRTMRTRPNSIPAAPAPASMPRSSRTNSGLRRW